MKNKNSVQEIYDKLRETGKHASDKLSAFIGSWGFIIFFAVFFFIWIAVNIYGFVEGFDPFPFILLNLALSAMAALQAPIIMMSQNRQADRDRKKQEIDYRINLHTEREIQEIKKELTEIRYLLHKGVGETKKGQDNIEDTR